MWCCCKCNVSDMRAEVHCHCGNVVVWLVTVGYTP